MYSDITIKLPDAQSIVLHKLYEIKEAVLNKSWDAAVRHCDDCVIQIQNEIDWTYQSDRILPFMREFILELQALLRVLDVNQQHVPALLDILRSTTEEVTQAASAFTAWNAPDKYLDCLEVEHRKQLYAKE